MNDFEDDEEGFDLYGDLEEEEVELPEGIQETIDRLRETLPHDRAVEMYKNANGAEPDDVTLDEFINELIAEQLNAGYDDWDESFFDWE